MDEHALECYRKAGKAASEVREWSRDVVKPGEKLLDVAEKIEAKITESGCGIGFPVNLAVNEVTAHYTPKIEDEAVFGESDVVSVDLGVHVDGYIADTAYTLDFSGRHTKMLEANELALERVIEAIKPGAAISELGRIVQDTLGEAGFKPIENLTGHEVMQYNLHAGFSIPNIPVSFERKVEEGMVLAVEPFATAGAGRVVESKQAEIYSLEEKKPIRMREARLILDEALKRGMLPFTGRWLVEKIPRLKLNLALLELIKCGAIKTYPTLHEVSGATVSQFEHTMIVTADGCEVTTK